MVGDFCADPATANTADTSDSDGGPQLGAHGIRVGDVVKVMEIVSGSGRKAGGKEKEKERGKGVVGVEGVVTKASEKMVSVAFGQSGGGGISKGDEETVDTLWGKKLWL